MSTAELLVRVEAIDNMLLACLNERARVCLEARGAELELHELGMNAALKSGNEGPLSDEQIVWLFDAIRDATQPL